MHDCGPLRESDYMNIINFELWKYELDGKKIIAVINNFCSCEKKA